MNEPTKSLKCSSPTSTPDGQPLPDPGAQISRFARLPSILSVRSIRSFLFLPFIVLCALSIVLCSCSSSQWARQTTTISIPHSGDTSATLVQIDRQGLALLGDAANMATVDQTSQSLKISVNGSTGKTTMGTTAQTAIGAVAGFGLSGGNPVGAAAGAALATGTAYLDKPSSSSTQSIPSISSISSTSSPSPIYGRGQGEGLLLDPNQLLSLITELQNLAPLLQQMQANGTLPARLQNCPVLKGLGIIK